MDAIQQLLSDYKLSDIIIILGLGYLAFLEIRKRLEDHRSEEKDKLKKYHQEESKKEDKEEEVNDRLDTIEEKLSADYIRIQKSESHLYTLQDEVKDLKTNVRDMRLEGFRSTILEAVSKCVDLNKPVSAEYYHSIFSTYRLYEDILEENSLENGQCELAIQMIKHSYSQRLSTDNFSESMYLAPDIAKEKIKRTSDMIPSIWEQSTKDN